VTERDAAGRTQLDRLGEGVSGDAPVRPTVAALARIVGQLHVVVEQQAATIADLAERLAALENEVGYPPKA
jgi:hypothetical protein